MATYPQTRSVHTIGEPAAGTKGNYDPAESSGETLRVDEASGIEFGTLLTLNATNDGYVLPSSSTVRIVGAAPSSLNSGGYDTNKYIQNDALTPIRRGYLFCKIDPDNKPSIGNTLRVSYETGKKGWVTSSATNSLSVSGLYVTSVYDTVAEIYFSGAAEYTTSP